MTKKTSPAAATGAEQAAAEAQQAGRRLAELTEQIKTEKARRHASVVKLRDEHGWSHQQVAEALGVSRGTAQALYEGRSSSGTQRRAASEVDQRDPQA